MSTRQKYDSDIKMRAVVRYLRKEASAKAIAKELGLGSSGHKRICEWANKFILEGEKGLQFDDHNRSYSIEIKKQAIDDYLQGRGSMETICLRYHISGHQTLRDWLRLYRNGDGLQEYDPHPEIFEQPTRKLSSRERKEIIEYCLNHEEDYKETAIKYNVSYIQVYSLVRYYRQKKLREPE